MRETGSGVLLLGVWFTVWLGASLAYRTSRGKPLVYRWLASVQFREWSATHTALGIPG